MLWFRVRPAEKHSSQNQINYRKHNDTVAEKLVPQKAVKCKSRFINFLTDILSTKQCIYFMGGQI